MSDQVKAATIIALGIACAGYLMKPSPVATEPTSVQSEATASSGLWVPFDRNGILNTATGVVCSATTSAQVRCVNLAEGQLVQP